MSELVKVDPEILGGTPVFAGTRVPVESLFEYLNQNYTLEEFCELFPTVSRGTAREVLNQAYLAYLEFQSSGSPRNA